MLAKIVGVIWLLSGVLWLIKPDMLKRRLSKKMNRKMKWTLYGFVFFFGIMLVGNIIKTQGAPPKIIGLLALIIIIKGCILLTSKASEKLLNWWSQKPLIFFRFWAFFLVIIGLGLILI